MGPAPQPLALQLLHREHQQTDALLGQLMAGEGDLLRACQRLCEQIELHMAIEEKIFYPALARLEMLASFVDHLQEQHAVIRQDLQALREMSPGDSGFLEAVRRLNESFDQHVADEESRGFAYATEHLAGELDALAVEMEDEREALRGAYGVG